MDLIQAAKEGNEDALTELFNQYRPIVYNLQKKYYIRDFDSDDWLQEGQIICYQIVKAFKEDNGATFGSFFKCAMENRVRSLLRKQHALKRRTMELSVSLEEKIETEGAEFLVDTQYEEPYALENLLIREALANYEFIFSALEKEVMSAYLLGASLEEIASHHVLDSKKIRSAYDRAKKKLGDQMNDYH
ncbi:RNA polymerase sporulation-specific sigma factor [Enterococcus sp. AZ194]|uniref:sigma-70 family RNA polymerase sigma factor n=1 Tax=Enterococcus sp. AZ194 TaxID=2774629 RepID=UPI003F1F0F92